MTNRVVITGMGAVSPLGLDIPSLWEALISGRSGVDGISLFDAEAFETKIAAEVKGFNATDYLEHKRARHMDRYTHFAMVASLQAVEQARLDFGLPEDIGVLIGSGIGGLTTLSAQLAVLAERGPSRISPFRTGFYNVGSKRGELLHHLLLFQRRRCYRRSW
jgi:3-oxoacyl-[acyl-carrier-protein] synthase II